MTNIVMCFEGDRAGSASNVTALVELLDQESQALWRGEGPHHPHPADGYRFLAQHWRPGDRIFVFGSGTGAFGAQALTRLLDTIGVRTLDDGILDYALSNWAMPRTQRTPEDWVRLNTLAAELRRGQPAVSVQYVGLWDSLKPAGLQSLSTPDNVRNGRHAIAIDERRAPEQALSRQVDEVWFRGSHVDVTGAAGADPGLARITFEWVLDGARRAGLLIRDELEMPSPAVQDALNTSRRTPAMSRLTGVRLSNRLRALPDGARVHASVDTYLRGHSEYWYRLPHCLTWADTDWPTRGERLAIVLSETAVARAKTPRHAILEQAS